MLMLRNYMELHILSGLAIFIYLKLIAKQHFIGYILAMMFYMPTISYQIQWLIIY
jgi:hypothetical protein